MLEVEPETASSSLDWTVDLEVISSATSSRSAPELTDDVCEEFVRGPASERFTVVAVFASEYEEEKHK